MRFDVHGQGGTLKVGYAPVATFGKWHITGDLLKEGAVLNLSVSSAVVKNAALVAMTPQVVELPVPGYPGKFWYWNLDAAYVRVSGPAELHLRGNFRTRP